MALTLFATPRVNGPETSCHLATFALGRCSAAAAFWKWTDDIMLLHFIISFGTSNIYAGHVLWVWSIGMQHCSGLHSYDIICFCLFICLAFCFSSFYAFWLFVLYAFMPFWLFVLSVFMPFGFLFYLFFFCPIVMAFLRHIVARIAYLVLRLSGQATFFHGKLACKARCCTFFLLWIIINHFFLKL